MASGRLDPELLSRLAARRPEIEAAILARMRSVEDPREVGDAEYVQGLRGAVRAALEHAIAVLEGGEARAEPIPEPLLSQARLAARNGVALDVVLRRYMAGHALLCDYLVQDVGEGASLRTALLGQARLLEQIVLAVADSYKQELESRRMTVEHRRAEEVRRLLAGEPQDAIELGYDLDGWHLGVVATGPGAPPALRELAAHLDRRLLLARPGGAEVWGWLGGTRRMEAQKPIERARAETRAALVVAIGEPGRGVSGWRLTHRQAKAALPVALRSETRVVSYCDVALLASVLDDEVLVNSLTETYLLPMAAERDGGATLREALRAYFAADRSVTSAAAALGVSRQTVKARLHSVEERIGRPLDACGMDLEIALRLWELREADPRPLHPVK